MVIKTNMTILKDSVNNSNTDKIALTLQCNMLHGLPKEIVLHPSSFPPRHFHQLRLHILQFLPPHRCRLMLPQHKADRQRLNQSPLSLCLFL